MAYRISQPLAATQFNDDKPKKGRKKNTNYNSASGTTQNTVTKRSGAQKITTTNKSGTKKTVEKVSRKGRVKSRTTDIDLAKGKATTTKRKGSKVVSKKTYKDLTPKQAMMVETGRDGLKAKAARNVKKSESFKDDDAKAVRKKYKKEQRENRRNTAGRARRLQNQRNRKNKKRRLKTVKEIAIDIKDRCKGKTKGTTKCASMSKRFK